MNITYQKNLLVTTLILVLAIGAIVSCESSRRSIAPSPPEPELGAHAWIPEHVFDFGYTFQKSKISHTFKIWSVGTDTVRISRIVTGCGCAKATLSDSLIAPGEFANLRVIFDTKTSRTRVTKRPKIFIVGQESPLSVQILATVLSNPDLLPLVEVSPYKLDISQFGQRLRDSLDFSISGRVAERLTLRVVDQGNEYYSLKYPATISGDEEDWGEDEDSQRAVVRIAPAYHDSSFNSSATFEVRAGSLTHPLRFTIPVQRTFRRFICHWCDSL